MRSIGIVKGLVKKFDVGQDRGNFYDLRKFLRDELNRVHVGFSDPCCPEANGGGTDAETFLSGLRYSAVTGGLEYYDPIGEDWTAFDSTPATITTNTINEQTAANGVTVDGALIKDGGITANSMYAGFFPSVAAQSLSGAGAVNVTSFLTKYTSTGAAEALTIASGTQIGQRKKISHVVDGGSGVLTGVFVGGTTITFTSVAEFADLLWTGTAWAVLELGNTATPATPPVLA